MRCAAPRPAADGVRARRFGWLLQMVPYEAANFASQLRVILAEPEMVALLQTAPQAGRALRPLCRMLGLGPTVLAVCRVTRCSAADVVASDETVGARKVPVPRRVEREGRARFSDLRGEVVLEAGRLPRSDGRWRR